MTPQEEARRINDLDDLIDVAFGYEATVSDLPRLVRAAALPAILDDADDYTADRYDCTPQLATEAAYYARLLLDLLERANDEEEILKFKGLYYEARAREALLAAEVERLTAENKETIDDMVERNAKLSERIEYLNGHVADARALVDILNRNRVAIENALRASGMPSLFTTGLVAKMARITQVKA